MNGDGLQDFYVCETGGLPNRLLMQKPLEPSRMLPMVPAPTFLNPVPAVC
ncbi:MAG TPA: hypothetical protein DCR17_09590 [Verrucomicrobiales bacterium]|nr:hypothetical protein [Verrucomicrobiales bacterium]HAQ98431.1 hypothetical protein [Verrucomicrobiales bacterium]HAW00693.1 hypothetical protein [Verrucomicrobiales bacterium]HBP56493.1 hypothetical protein [Verrucomicrobiales bacterium]HCP37390.1 hypothetical protein [Verrucomicrobiales bacterium]